MRPAVGATLGPCHSRAMHAVARGFVLFYDPVRRGLVELCQGRRRLPSKGWNPTCPYRIQALRTSACPGQYPATPASSGPRPDSDLSPPDSREHQRRSLSPLHKRRTFALLPSPSASVTAARDLPLEPPPSLRFALLPFRAPSVSRFLPLLPVERLAFRLALHLPAAKPRNQKFPQNRASFLSEAIFSPTCTRL